MNEDRYITINSDEWEDAGKRYKVLSYHRRENSTAVELKLEHDGGQPHHRVVPYHWIKWVENGD
jgi:hypothetical protein